MKLRAARSWAVLAALMCWTVTACGDSNGGTPPADVPAGTDADATEVSGDVTVDVDDDADAATDVGDDAMDVPGDAPADVPEDADVTPDVTDADDVDDTMDVEDADDTMDVEDVDDTMDADDVDDTVDVDEDTADVEDDTDVVVPTGCAAVGATCEPGVDDNDDFVCVAAVSGGGVCREACMGFLDCPFDEICLTESLAGGFCVPGTCTDYFADTCGAGAFCLVFEGETDGNCELAGPGGEGTGCVDHSDCNGATLCFGGVCRTPDCTPGGAPACTEGTCEPFEAFGDDLAVGLCTTACTPFAADDGCPEGTWCLPDGEDASMGLCVPFSPDNAELGEACGPGACCTPSVESGCSDPTLEACVCAEDDYCCSESGEWDTVCVDIARDVCGACAPSVAATCGPDLYCVGAACRGLCDLTDAGGCPAGEACFSVVVDEEILAFGTCMAGCVPFTDDPTCGEGETCRPTGLGGGQCEPVDAANAALGAACGELSTSDTCCDPEAPCEDEAVVTCTCQLDTYCCFDWDDLCAEQAVTYCGLGCSTPEQTCAADLVCDGGVCDEGCLPTAQTGSPGACETAGEVCRALGEELELLAYGVCSPACDLAGEVACVDAGEFCALGVAVGAASDVCLDVPADVPGFPLAAEADCPGDADDGVFCGPDRVCMDGICSRLCLAANGPLDEADHPDCQNAALECEGVTAAVGVCVTD